MKELFIEAIDGYKLCIHVFESENPKAIIQVAHGMEEKQNRYEELASYLCSEGYTVVTADMRGHGHHCEELGFFKDKKGDEYLVQDMLSIRNYIEEIYPNKSCYLFAHSMGTITTRVFLQQYSSKFSKVVLCGYPNYQAIASLGVGIANLVCLLKGNRSKSNLLKSLTTGSLNKSIKNPKTPIDWISYNEDNLKTYIDDPYCGFGFTSSAYRDLLVLMNKMGKVNKFKNVNEDLVILLTRGIDDPCVGYEKGKKDTFDRLTKAGFKNIKCLDYPNMRHEILNEKDYQKVYLDIKKFFDE